MFLTMTTTGSAERPATDLGFLLHKHPDRAQEFSTSHGTAHVFYPEAGPERCTAALLLEVDPVALVRRLFQPLGWTVGAQPVPLDARFPEWGDSRYPERRRYLSVCGEGVAAFPV
ncbi:hypothetical protein GCM10023079_49400 [Streptomyces chitinivorans]